MLTVVIIYLFIYLLPAPFSCHTGHCGRATSAQATDTPVSGSTRIALTSQTLLLNACTYQNRTDSQFDKETVLFVFNAALKLCVTALA
jgi:hypothetical protein